MRVYFFEISSETKTDEENLPKAVIEHCKKIESFAAAEALIQMGAENLHYNDKKKPLADNCFVSISHSGNMVAVCTSDKPVGIDIERIDYDKNVAKIAKRFYHGQELDLFNANPTAEQFFKIWTMKEAYSKITGEGVGDVFAGFDVYSLDNYNFTTDFIGEYAISVCEES